MEILQGIPQMVIAFAGVAIHGFDGRPRHPVRRHAARVIAFAGVAVFAGWLRGMPVWPQALPGNCGGGLGAVRLPCSDD